jgi:hypothetical protein
MTIKDANITYRHYLVFAIIPVLTERGKSY